MIAMMNLIKYVVLMVVVPYLNFLYWREYGFQQHLQFKLIHDCPILHPSEHETAPHSHHVHTTRTDKCSPITPVPTMKSEQCGLIINQLDHGDLKKVDSKEFGSYKKSHLIHVSPGTPTTTVLLADGSFKPGKSASLKVQLQETYDHCHSIPNPTASLKKDCLAVVHANVSNAYNRLRIGITDEKEKTKIDHPTWNGDTVYQPTGFFGRGHMGKSNGRNALLEKIGPLYSNLAHMETLISSVLSNKGINKGDDVVLIVLNDGEIDIFYNFACSCKAHGLLEALHRVVVFSASAELVPMIESAGAIGIYHESFSPVNRGASYAYLDKTFTDMMWYKSFSLWLMLHLGYNVLFQDADLVWFKDPFPYFHQEIKENHNRLMTFFSDDGQRSMRYTPFYANSGFYYLPSAPYTIYFSSQIVLAFDSLYTMGSHQNIFTTKLMEMMDLGGITSRMLDLSLFPTGVQYHHNKKFMERLKANNGSEAPYNFHMCWTSHKRDKIKFFKELGMWYLEEKCWINDLTPSKYNSKRSMNRQIVDGYNALLDKKAGKHVKESIAKSAMDLCCLTPNSKTKYTIFK